MALTHLDLVNVAYRWVLNNGKCGVAVKEFYSAAINGEYPDVLGFGGWNHSVLVECKASRSDFHSDKKKTFRKNPEFGMGKFRFYCCPTGMLKVEDLPEKWGLLYVNEKHKAICVHNPYTGHDYVNRSGQYLPNAGPFDQNLHAEHSLMYSILRRLHIRGHIESIYTDNPASKITEF